MKKTALAVIVISVISLSAAVEAGLTNFGMAEFIPNRIRGGTIKPWEVGAEPPTITIISPQNNSVFNQDKLTLFLHAQVGNSSTYTDRWLNTVHYRADWLQDDIYIYTKGSTPSIDQLPTSLNLTGVNGTRIPEGRHNVTVYAKEEGSYTVLGEIVGAFQEYIDYTFFVYGSSKVEFTIDYTAPTVSILSMKNKTYATFDVPLDFAVNESASQIKYSVDGQNNVTLANNTMLTGLSSGEHSLTVYATDEAGNVGSSEKINFSVTPFPTALVVASLLVVVVVAIGLLVYFKKSHRNKK